MSAEIRRIQLTGGATYVVSLPKDWARSVGLKPGHQVTLIPQSDSSLLIVPRGEAKIEPGIEAFMEVSSSMDPEVAVRNFISYYLTGHEMIRIRFHQGTSKHRAVLKEVARRKLMGVEVIEESADELLTQCLIGYSELPVKKAVNRMSIIAASMHKDAISAYANCDQGLAGEVISRDDEVDRFYFFIVRQLKMAVQNRALSEEIGLGNPRDCLGYRLVAKSIERVADHAARIAYMALALDRKLSPEALNDALKVSELAGQVYSEALKALEELDAKVAHHCISRSVEAVDAGRRTVEELVKLNLDVKSIVSLSLVLDSLRRIAEYGADIAEVTINLATPNAMAVRAKP
ncbi:MAG: phosphate uptake regulator PhoU [Thermoprotei archaeon]|nr:MAG: phosphate uptake regulator PhoU [Thermoprotei archaeon]RLF11928.1 MAG: phosphate uptake regulator PhoU [Thermoprotei archaeon]RLF13732.1 MAG: phosphate uptake regulator PhoU [Thermoprotei archaeon]